ncbi:hypothetical protein ACVWYF_004109 [Hymenobacter sp. UYAg731]
MLPHLHMPRRYRRKPLFPPGMLALAWLLWLGCVAIRPWQKQLQPRYATILTLPPKPQSDNIYQSIDIKTIPFLYSQLSSLYAWQDIELNGSPAHDSFAMRAISQSIETMRNDTIPNCGVRVRIRPSTRYKELVGLLDLMTKRNQKRYLLDIYHSQTTLYVLVDSYVPQPIDSIPAYFSCGTRYYELPPIPPPLPQQSFADKWLQPLRQPQWRASVWLLAAIVGLGGWRMVRHS